VRALGGKLSAYKFAHGARHELGGYALFDSYHCSRYNTNTGRLTPEMFEDVFASVRAELIRT
jgi:uracil-DNA glycosylase